MLLTKRASGNRKQVIHFSNKNKRNKVVRSVMSKEGIVVLMRRTAADKNQGSGSRSERKKERRHNSDIGKYTQEKEVWKQAQR